MIPDSVERHTAALQEKLHACRRSLEALGSVVVAFSAGVDSTLLLALAVEALGADNVLAAIGVSPSLPERERRGGQVLAGKLGAPLVEVPTGEMDNPAYAANPNDRCYYCKSDLFARLARLARQRGLRAVVCGANADDRGDFRPGLRAGAELGVRNPLMDAGLTKRDIRDVSRAMGLETWDKPAMACLASRVPYGRPITTARLSRIERAEYHLRDMGFAQCRLRDHDALARIEVPPEHVAQAARLREDIVPAIKALGYTYVCLDLQGFRSGSMNEVIQGHERAEF